MNIVQLNNSVFEYTDTSVGGNGKLVYDIVFHAK